MDKTNKFLKDFSQWAKNEDNIIAVALVGSYANGTAKEESDIDLMIIAKNPEEYIQDESWIKKFGAVKEIKNEVWGQVKTKRVFYKNGMEIEFNFDKKSWANPEDSGTRRVINDGIRILVDKERILENLSAAVLENTHSKIKN